MVLLHHEHVTIVCLSEHKATKKYRKNLPKTLPKRSPNPSKIDAKNMLFFTIHFYGFGPRFWRVLGLQVGAKLALNGSQTWRMRPFKNLLKLDVLKNGVLEASRLDFGGPGARFLRPRGSIWERSGAMFSRFLPRMPRLPRTPRTPAKTRPRSQMRQEWVGGGAPPPGGFNGILKFNAVTTKLKSSQRHRPCFTIWGASNPFSKTPRA